MDYSTTVFSDSQDPTVLYSALFKPDEETKRWEVAAALFHMDGSPETVPVYFADTGDAVLKYVSWAAN